MNSDDIAFDSDQLAAMASQYERICEAQASANGCPLSMYARNSIAKQIVYWWTKKVVEAPSVDLGPSILQGSIAPGAAP